MKKMTFKSTDSDKSSLPAVSVSVIRQLTEKEANNQEETGPMWLIQMPDGSYEHAFDDELEIAA